VNDRHAPFLHHSTEPADIETVSLTSTHPVVACAGIPIASLSPRDAAHKLIWLARAPKTTGIDVHLCNAYTLALADRDPEFHRLLRDAMMNLPDGTPVVWANRLLHPEEDIPKQRVRGPGLFLDVFELGQEVGLRHYLLGSTPEVLEALCANLADSFPAAQVVGVESPPFRELTEAEQAEQLARIEASGAEIVWVGLGTPKQDVECARMAKASDRVFVAVGAAFDFAAGTKSEAAPWMQNNGLEWMHRLSQEPGRLWKRYLFGNARFVRATIQRRRA
jgi:N-acetylglucosaminyldiphosphoundecaprenol N-acetyl-beta-D-mannosaminyltransferase